MNNQLASIRPNTTFLFNNKQFDSLQYWRLNSRMSNMKHMHGDLFLIKIDNNVEIHVRDSSAKMSSELHQNLTQQSKVLCILECWECSFHLEMTAFCRIRFFLRTSEFHLEQVGLMTSSRLCDVWKPSSWLSASVSISIFWTISFSMS